MGDNDRHLLALEGAAEIASILAPSIHSSASANAPSRRNPSERSAAASGSTKSASVRPAREGGSTVGSSVGSAHSSTEDR